MPYLDTLNINGTDYELGMKYTHSLDPDSNDFNDFTEPGKYSFGTGQTPLNGPDVGINSWVLLVIANSSRNYIQQFATAMAGIECYERYCDHGTWSAWVRFDNYGIKNIYSGTADPDNSVGVDGDVYIKYTT